MFGNKKKAPAEPKRTGLSAEDREFLEGLVGELVSALYCGDGTTLLEECTDVTWHYIPEPGVAFEYPDKLVTVRFEIDREGFE